MPQAHSFSVSRTLPAPVAYAIGVTLAALLSVACRSREADVVRADAAPARGAVASVSSRPQPPSSAPPDVCALLPAPALARASGLPITVAEATGTGQCTYRTSDHKQAYFLWVLVFHGVHAGGTKQDAKTYLDMMRPPDGQMRVLPGRDVVGVGDEAILIDYSSPKRPSNTKQIEILARKGDSLVSMQRISTDPPEAIIATATQALGPVFGAL